MTEQTIVRVQPLEVVVVRDPYDWRTDPELPYSVKRAYDKIAGGDELRIDSLLEAVRGCEEVQIAKADGSFEFVGRLGLSDRDRDILLSAGLLSYTQSKVDG